MYNQIIPGINIDILRTDGRVHSAIIRSVNKKSLLITVEWYEKGESKGKEIDFDSIFTLNPSLKMTDDDTLCQELVDLPEMKISTDVIPLKLENVESHQINEISAPPKIKLTHLNPVLVTTDSKCQDADIGCANKSHVALMKTVKESHNMSFSLINSTFGWMKGNKTKNPPKQLNCLKEVMKIPDKRKKRLEAMRIFKEKPEYDPTNPNFEFLMMIRDYQKTVEYTSLTSYDMVEKHLICVCVRKRPLNLKELNNKEIDVITIPNKQNVVVHEPKLKVDLTKYLENQNFRFDYAFDENVDNAIVYRYAAKPLVECLFEKGMATCFAYGQTGSGKTHTMGGEFHGKGQQNYSNGIYVLAARDVFRLLNTKYRTEELYVECAFFEIYGGKVYDLLNKRQKLRVLEDHRGKIQIVGLKSEVVTNVDEVLNILQNGNIMRVSGQTSANQHSSRSHAVFQIILKKKHIKRLYGKFSLIDLAGNERGADTRFSDRITRMEGAEINKSLLALKECIRALGRKGTHRPFRTSKLTQILKDSFIGDQSRTCMIIMISPGMQSCEHTLNTLRYGDRVKELGPNGTSISAENISNITVAPISGSGDEIWFEESDDLQTMENGNTSNEEEEIKDDNEDVCQMASKSAFLPSIICSIDSSNSRIVAQSDQIEFEEDEHTIIENNVKTDCKLNLNNTSSISKSFEAQEREVYKRHEKLLEDFSEWIEKHNNLYKETEYIDFDVKSYISRLTALVSEQINELILLKDKVTILKSKMMR